MFVDETSCVEVLQCRCGNIYNSEEFLMKFFISHLDSTHGILILIEMRAKAEVSYRLHSL